MRVDMAELLRYWGALDTTDPQLLEIAMRAEQIALSAAQPRIVYADFPCSIDGEQLKIADFCVQSRSLSRFLAGCTRVIMLAATLGTDIDFQIRRCKHDDMATASAISAAGSSAIECFLDEQYPVFRTRYGSITRRFSPGYGDFSLQHQSDFFRLLPINSRLGITLTDSLLMIPSKSVTAIIGIYPTAQNDGA